jgi:predicted nucleic acid-binding protein
VARLADALARHSTIAVDTSPFIYYIEGHPQFGPLAREIFDQISVGTCRGVTSVVTLMEIIVKPNRDQQLGVANEYATILSQLPNLDVVPVDNSDAWRAGTLRAMNTIRPADALQIATCIGAGATVFVTNDRRLRQINEIDVLILGDHLDSDGE